MAGPFKGLAPRISVGEAAVRGGAAEVSAIAVCVLAMLCAVT